MRNRIDSRVRKQNALPELLLLEQLIVIFDAVRRQRFGDLPAARGTAFERLLGHLHAVFHRHPEVGEVIGFLDHIVDVPADGLQRQLRLFGVFLLSDLLRDQVRDDSQDDERQNDKSEKCGENAFAEAHKAASVLSARVISL
jgi:hypothetical protein